MTVESIELFDLNHHFLSNLGTHSVLSSDSGALTKAACNQTLTAFFVRIAGQCSHVSTLPSCD